jgi:hypothetical protein
VVVVVVNYVKKVAMQRRALDEDTTTATIRAPHAACSFFRSSSFSFVSFRCARKTRDKNTLFVHSTNSRRKARRSSDTSHA